MTGDADMKHLRLVLAVFLFASVVMAVFAIVPAYAKEEAPHYDISVEGSPYMGAKDAPVTIVEFIDYQ